MMTSIENLLLRGPPNGDVRVGLDSLRESILSHGIPSNSDGMVCFYYTTNPIFKH